MNQALRDAGFDVINLGVAVPQEKFINAAVVNNADAILVPSLYGQRELYCRGMREKCNAAGLDDIILYVGGNLTTSNQDFKVVAKRYKNMGFDRVFPPDTDPLVDINFLKEDLK